MAKLQDPEFQDVCLNFWALSKAHRVGAPKLPPSFDKLINQGGIDTQADYPLNRYFPALSIALSKFTEREQVAFYTVYISSPYRNGKKLPMKVIAHELGLNRPNVYKMANEIAIKLWRNAKEIADMNSKMMVSGIDLQVD